jgi:hypothetical protein
MYPNLGHYKKIMHDSQYCYRIKSKYNIDTNNIEMGDYINDNYFMPK